MRSIFEFAETYGPYTYRDYASWGEGFRCELINGIVYMMSSPSLWHQRLIKKLILQLEAYLKDKPCEVFIAPVDVILCDDDSDTTIVQPDIFIVCDKSKLKSEKECRGAPDFIIEVVSGSSAIDDMNRKHDLYQEYGVKEYWVVFRNKVIQFDFVGNSKTEHDIEDPIATVKSVNFGFDLNFNL